MVAAASWLATRMKDFSTRRCGVRRYRLFGGCAMLPYAELSSCTRAGWHVFLHRQSLGTSPTVAGGAGRGSSCVVPRNACSASIRAVGDRGVAGPPALCLAPACWRCRQRQSLGTDQIGFFPPFAGGRVAQ